MFSFILLKEIKDKEGTMVCIQIVFDKWYIQIVFDKSYWKGKNCLTLGSMFLISNTIIKQVVKCRINAMALLDHAPVELGIDINTDVEKKGRWRMKTSFIQDENFNLLLKKDIKSFLEN